MAEYRIVMTTKERHDAIQRARELNRKGQRASIMQRGDTYYVRVLS